MKSDLRPGKFSSLFEDLLQKFPLKLRTAAVKNGDDLEAFAIAKSGFVDYAPVDDWTHHHEDFIQERLQGDLSSEALEWYQECAEAVRFYSCLALGALLGKYSTEEIGDNEFLLAELLMGGFIMNSNEAICSFWEEFQKTHAKDT